LLGLLVVAVEGLVSSDPCVITLDPYKNDDTTGPPNAMVLWSELDVVPLKVCELVVSPYDRPSAKEHLLFDLFWRTKNTVVVN
jgi:hypothetical protein